LSKIIGVFILLITITITSIKLVPHFFSQCPCVAASVCARNLVAFHKRHLTWPRCRQPDRHTRHKTHRRRRWQRTWHMIRGSLGCWFGCCWVGCSFGCCSLAVVVVADSWSSSGRMCCAFFTSICLAFVAADALHRALSYINFVAWRKAKIKMRL